MLKERYESAPEEDEVAHDVSDLEHDDVGKCFLFFLDLFKPDAWYLTEEAVWKDEYRRQCQSSTRIFNSLR